MAIDTPVSLTHPRMSPELYQIIRNHYVHRLREHFKYVLCGPEAPQKTSYGDVDLLLCCPTTPVLRICEIPVLEECFEAPQPLQRMAPHLLSFLQARSYLIGRLVLESTPQGQVLGVGPLQRDNAEQDRTIEHEFGFQIDFSFCDKESWMKWETLFQAHGDLSDMIYRGLMPAGFTLRPSGLFIRNPDIEVTSREASYVYLSNDIETIFEFFGLDYGMYLQSFTTEAELFDYVASMRFFSGAAFNDPRESKTLNDSSRGSDCTGSTSHSIRMLKREQYMRFKNEYLPAHPDLRDRQFNRHELLPDILEFFAATQRYHAAAANYYRAKAEDEFWKKIAIKLPVLTKNQNVSKTLRTRLPQALKRWTVFRKIRGRGPSPFLVFDAKDCQPDLAKTPSWTAAMDEGGPSYQEMEDWIAENWMLADEREQSRTRQARHRKVAMREERKREGKQDIVGGEIAEAKVLEDET